MDPFHGIRDRIDLRPSARVEYETRVASRDLVLDVGGRNARSRSNRRLRELSTNPRTKIVSTDILPEYEPDLVDDICRSRIPSESYDGLYVDAILEHTEDYWSAMEHIHRILRPGGEVFIYVPFFWCVHDRMDYHRFTFAELDRMLGRFAEHRLFLPDGRGYGGVLWQVLTCYTIDRAPALLGLLARCTNGALAVGLAARYLLGRLRRGGRDVSFRDYRFFYTHFYISHGFCAWARK